MTALRFVGPVFVLAASASAVAVELLPAGARFGAGLGLALAVGTGAATLSLMAYARGRPVTLALGVVTLGFLMRIVLLGGGLWLTAHSGGSMVACAAAFLGFYAVGQTLEIALMSGKIGPVPQEGRA